MYNTFHLFDNKASHAMSNKYSLLLYCSANAIVKNAYISIFRIMQPKIVDELLRKVRDVKDIIWPPYLIPTRIVPKSQYPRIFQTFDFRKPKWPEGARFSISPRPFGRASKTVNKDYVEGWICRTAK